MDLDQSEDSVWNGYSSENRNKIRKSIKSGVHVKCSSDYEALTIFSSLYERHMSELNAEDIYFFGENYFKIFFLSARIGSKCTLQKETGK